MNRVGTQVFKATDFDTNFVLLQKEHHNILVQLETVPDYCAACTPGKSKK